MDIAPPVRGLAAAATMGESLPNSFSIFSTTRFGTGFAPLNPSRSAVTGPLPGGRKQLLLPLVTSSRASLPNLVHDSKNQKSNFQTVPVAQKFDASPVLEHFSTRFGTRFGTRFAPLNSK